MTKSEAEDYGCEVIEFIKRNCDRNTKWAHDVLACTDNRKAAAVDVRAEAHKYLKETIAHHQGLVDCIHDIIDLVPDEVENPVELPSVPEVNSFDILDAIKKNHEGKNTKSRALAVVLRQLNDSLPAQLFDLKLEHWLRHENCGRKTANFIMQTLANMRGAA